RSVPRSVAPAPSFHLSRDVPRHLADNSELLVDPLRPAIHLLVERLYVAAQRLGPFDVSLLVNGCLTCEIRFRREVGSQEHGHLKAEAEERDRDPEPIRKPSPVQVSQRSPLMAPPRRARGA